MEEPFAAENDENDRLISYVPFLLSRSNKAELFPGMGRPSRRQASIKSGTCPRAICRPPALLTQTAQLRDTPWVHAEAESAIWLRSLVSKVAEGFLADDQHNNRGWRIGPVQDCESTHDFPSDLAYSPGRVVALGVDLRPFFRRLRDVMLRPIRHEMAAEVAELRATIDQLRAARRDDAELTRAAFAVMEKTSAHLAQKIDQVECECQQIKRDRQKLNAGVADLEMLLTSSTAVRPPGAAQILAAMPSPVVSVVVPTLNRAPVVADAIASVQAQQFRDWELIVVDDGSTDSTASIVEPFLADKRIRYVYQPSAGVAAARNHGIRLRAGR